MPISKILFVSILTILSLETTLGNNHADGADGKPDLNLDGVFAFGTSGLQMIMRTASIFGVRAQFGTETEARITFRGQPSSSQSSSLANGHRE